jgi:hypothetical protein
MPGMGGGAPSPDELGDLDSLLKGMGGKKR